MIELRSVLMSSPFRFSQCAGKSNSQSAYHPRFSRAGNVYLSRLCCSETAGAGRDADLPHPAIQVVSVLQYARRRLNKRSNIGLSDCNSKAHVLRIREPIAESIRKAGVEWPMSLCNTKSNFHFVAHEQNVQLCAALGARNGQECGSPGCMR